MKLSNTNKTFGILFIIIALISFYSAYSIQSATSKSIRDCQEQRDGVINKIEKENSEQRKVVLDDLFYSDFKDTCIAAYTTIYTIPGADSSYLEYTLKNAYTDEIIFNQQAATEEIDEVQRAIEAYNSRLSEYRVGNKD